MRAAVFLVAATLAAGCGSRDEGVTVVLADARLVFGQADGTEHVIALKADGKVNFDGEPVIEIHRDGQLSADGKKFGQLHRDGMVYAQGVATNVRIHRDGAFEMDGAIELSIGSDGHVDGPLLETMDHPMLPIDPARVKYEGSPGARRAVMLGFAAFVTNVAGAQRPTN